MVLIRLDDVWKVYDLGEVQVERTVLVIGHEADQVRQTCGVGLRYAEQTVQRGTGHAVLMVSLVHVPLRTVKPAAVLSTMIPVSSGRPAYCQDTCVVM